MITPWWRTQTVELAYEGKCARPGKRGGSLPKEQCPTAPNRGNQNSKGVSAGTPPKTIHVPAGKNLWGRPKTREVPVPSLRQAAIVFDAAFRDIEEYSFRPNSKFEHTYKRVTPPKWNSKRQAFEVIVERKHKKTGEKKHFPLTYGYSTAIDQFMVS